MVKEFVKTVVEGVCVPPSQTDFKVIEDIISGWKVTKQAPSYVKIESEDNTPENKKMIILSDEKTQIGCLNQHKGNSQNLRELTNALLKLAAHPQQEEVGKSLKRMPVVTQLIYENYPSRLRDGGVAYALGDFMNSALRSMIVEAGDLVYGFNKGKNKFNVAFTRPLGKIEIKYPRVSEGYIFEEPKRDVGYIS